MIRPRAVDCQGLAGAFTLGTAQAGFSVEAKLELPGGFGMANVEANRDLVNPRLETQVGPWEAWEPYDGIDYVFGNPPCSGFSLLNTAATQKAQVNVRNHRGWDSPINDCMWALVEYAGRVNSGRGPLYLAMESVQGAYKQGRVLMQKLRLKLEESTGRAYTLTHLLVSGSSLGAYQRRHRYYMVLTREGMAPQFTVDVPEPRRPLGYDAAIGDLQFMRNTWEEQPYSNDGTHELRNPAGVVDSHVAPGVDGTKHCTQVYALLESGVWAQGDAMVDALRKYYEARGEMPRGFDEERVLRKNWHLGFHQPRRVRWDQEGYVVTGSGGYDFIHPTEDRFLTVRECARLQGFPDAWSFRGAGDKPRVPYAWIGKGVPVQCGRWVSEQVRASLLGEERSDRRTVGELIGDRERLIDITYAWRGR